MEQQQPPRRRRKGGLITMPFIIGTHFLLTLWFEGCQGQLTRTSTYSLSGPVKNRPSTTGLRNSEEIFLRLDPQESNPSQGANTLTNRTNPSDWESLCIHIHATQLL